MSEILFIRCEDVDYGTYYMPTTLGYTALALLMLVLLIIACLVTSGHAHRMRAKELAFCGLAVALAYVTSLIKVIDMPMGGAVTLFSMMFITLVGYWYGLKTGLMVAVTYGLLQLATNPWIISLPQMLFDYIFAFGALGLSGVFSNSNHGMLKGYLLGVLGRFCFSFISGMAFFGSSGAAYNMSAALYSFVYNLCYLGTEAVITVVLLLLPPVSSALKRIKNEAL